MKIAIMLSLLFVVAALGIYLLLSKKTSNPLETLSLAEAQKIAEDYLRGDPNEMIVEPEKTRE